MRPQGHEKDKQAKQSTRVAQQRDGVFLDNLLIMTAPWQTQPTICCTAGEGERERETLPHVFIFQLQVVHYVVTSRVLALAMFRRGM